MLRDAPDKKKRRKQKQMRNEGLHRRKENNTPEGAGDDPKRESDNEDPLRIALQGERRERKERERRLKKAEGGTEILSPTNEQYEGREREGERRLKKAAGWTERGSSKGGRPP